MEEAQSRPYTLWIAEFVGRDVGYSLATVIPQAQQNKGQHQEQAGEDAGTLME